MIPIQKLKPSELKMSCENVKSELFESINDENKRINIDSAKKRAVLQGMDYDGFRQMVLGANIFPIKSKEFTELIGDNKPKSGIFTSKF
jgi:Dynein attachment factor N-terminus